jgi:hypothetical protein
MYIREIYYAQLLGFCALSIVRYCKKLEKAKFRNMDLLSSAGEGETPTLLGSLERANLINLK